MIPLFISFLVWIPIVLSIKQNSELIVLSPTDNQQYTLGDTILFDYVPIDSSLEQLNIYLDYYGTKVNEIEVKLVADISSNPNGTYTSTTGQTFKKYSLSYTIPTNLPVQGESFEANFQTAAGNVLVPIIINQALSSVSSAALATTSSSSLSSTALATSSNANILSSTAVATTGDTTSTASATSSSMIPTAIESSASSDASSSSSFLSTAIGRSFPSSSVSTAIPSSPISSAIASSIAPSSSSALSLSASTQTVMSASGFPSPSLIASTTPIPPDVGTFIHHSNANFLKTDHFFVTSILISVMALI